MEVQGEVVAQDVMAAMAREAVLPLLDRPLPIRKRQRKPMRKSKPVELEADSFPPASPNKRGRKPKGAGGTPVFVCFAVLL